MTEHMIPWQVLASEHELNEVNARKVLLVGNAVYAELSHDAKQAKPAAAPEDFIAQVPREAKGGVLSHLSKRTSRVWLYVHERVLDLPKVRFAFALDGYLNWGLRNAKKGAVVLFGGAETASETCISILVFVDGDLVYLGEKSLPASTATYYRDALNAMVSEMHLQYPTARFVQAAPLTEWSLDGGVSVEYIGDAPLRRLTFRPLARGYSRRSAYLIPLAIGTLGVAVYAGAVGLGWSKYSTAISDYDVAVADSSIQAKGGVDTEFLSIMNARRIYMDQPRRQTALAEKASDIVRGIGAVPSVQIMEMKLPAPSLNPQLQIGVSPNPMGDAQRQKITPERSPDVWIAVSVPKSADPAMTQATSVINDIGRATGMSLRLAHNGWREDKGRRILSIEGFIHD